MYVKTLFRVFQYDEILNWQNYILNLIDRTSLLYKRDGVYWNT